MRVCKLTKYGYVVAEFPSDDPKNTPLHVACLTHYPGQFILEHLMTEKQHISTQNSDGELPLHYAMKDKKGVENEVLDALLSAYPDATRHQDIGELYLESPYYYYTMFFSFHNLTHFFFTI